MDHPPVASRQYFMHTLAAIRRFIPCMPLESVKRTSKELQVPFVPLQEEPGPSGLDLSMMTLRFIFFRVQDIQW